MCATVDASSAAGWAGERFLGEKGHHGAGLNVYGSIPSLFFAITALPSLVYARVPRGASTYFIRARLIQLLSGSGGRPGC